MANEKYVVRRRCRIAGTHKKTTESVSTSDEMASDKAIAKKDVDTMTVDELRHDFENLGLGTSGSKVLRERLREALTTDDLSGRRSKDTKVKL